MLLPIYTPKVKKDMGIYQTNNHSLKTKVSLGILSILYKVKLLYVYSSIGGYTLPRLTKQIIIN